VPGEEAVPETDRSHPLLWAIVDFRETLDRLIEDQKELILSRGTEPATSEPSPTPHGFAAPIAVTPLSMPVPILPMSVAPAPPSLTPPHKGGGDKTPPSRQTDGADARDNAPHKGGGDEKTPFLLGGEGRGGGSGQAPADPDPAGQAEDPRKRLDALAKLLDRRLKHATTGSVEPSPHPGEG
jgi:hypothetical protein